MCHRNGVQTIASSLRQETNRGGPSSASQKWACTSWKETAVWLTSLLSSVVCHTCVVEADATESGWRVSPTPSCVSHLCLQPHPGLAVCVLRRAGTSNKMITIIKTQEDFGKALKDAGDQLVVAAFTSQWCPPSKMTEPISKHVDGLAGGNIS